MVHLERTAFLPGEAPLNPFRSSAADPMPPITNDKFAMANSQSEPRRHTIRPIRRICPVRTTFQPPQTKSKHYFSFWPPPPFAVVSVFQSATRNPQSGRLLSVVERKKIIVLPIHIRPNLCKPCECSRPISTAAARRLKTFFPQRESGVSVSFFWPFSWQRKVFPPGLRSVPTPPKRRTGAG